jgi:hypothetical protein
MYKIPLPFRPLSRYVDRGPFALLLLKPDGAVLDLRERFDSAGTFFVAPSEDLLVERSSRADHARAISAFRPVHQEYGSMHCIAPTKRRIISISASATPLGQKQRNAGLTLFDSPTADWVRGPPEGAMSSQLTNGTRSRRVVRLNLRRGR